MSFSLRPRIQRTERNLQRPSKSKQEQRKQEDPRSDDRNKLREWLVGGETGHLTGALGDAGHIVREAIDAHRVRRCRSAAGRVR